MNVSWLVAQRYIRPRRLSIIGVIGAVSIVGIVIGTAALVIVMSLFNGLRGVANDLMIGFGPHIQIVPLSGPVFIDADNVDKIVRQTLQIETLTGQQVNTLTRFAVAPTFRSQLVIQSGNRTGVIQGVGLDDPASAVFNGPRRATILGSFIDSTSNGIVLAAGIAEQLQLYLGDTVKLIAPRMIERSLTMMTMPTGVNVVVKGIFQSNTARDVDQQYAYMSGETVRTLMQQTAPSTIDIMLADVHEIDVAVQALEGIPSARVTTWTDLNRGLVDTMKLEGIGSFIVLALIVLVASFNVLVSLTLGVFEKRRDIAMLLTLGLTPSDIRRLYVMQGLTLGVISVALGLIVGLAVCWGQQTFHWVAFDMTQGYLVPALPVDIQTFDVVIVAITGLLFAGTAALYPASRASKTVIAEAIRVE